MSRKTRRQKLQNLLENIPGIKKVYFQPPASISMHYPCIVFSYDDDNKRHANNLVYLMHDRYTVTLITKEAMPDEVLSELDSIPYSDFDRHYVNDNLHHFSYTIVMSERV